MVNIVYGRIFTAVFGNVLTENIPNPYATCENAIHSTMTNRMYDTT